MSIERMKNSMRSIYVCVYSCVSWAARALAFRELYILGTAASLTHPRRGAGG